MSASTQGQVEPQRLADTAAEWINGAQSDPRLSERLAAAQTSVHIHFTDTIGVTFWLDRSPISAEPRIVGDAEVEMWGDPDIFVAIVRREKQMAMAITDGELEYSGPVRKFLRIVPILRSLDFSMWRELLRNGATPPTAQP